MSVTLLLQEPGVQCGSFEKTFVTKHSVFCSPICRRIAGQGRWQQWYKDNPDRSTTFSCNYCGELKTMRTTLYERQIKVHKNTFCSHACSLSAQWNDKNSALSISRQVHTQVNTLDSTI